MTGARVHPFVQGVLRGADVPALLPLVSGPGDWETVFQDAAVHGLTPLLYRRLTSAGAGASLPRLVADRLQREVFGLAGRTLLLAEELRAILLAFGDHGVRCAPIRGPALAERLYGDVTARPTGDLDVLVREEDLPRVATTLGTLGFRQLDRRPGFARDFSYTLVFLKDRCGWVVAEPHWTIAYPPFAASLDMRPVWERCVRGRVLGVDAWMLGREDLILHLSLHLMHPDGGAPLLWLYELDRLLRLEAALIDWRRLLLHAREAKLDFLLCEALSRVRQVFGTIPAPAELLQPPMRPESGKERRLRRLIECAAAGGREELGVLLTLPGLRARLRYTAGLLFPSADFMRIQHGLTGRPSLGAAYARRASRLSFQGARVLARVLLGPLLPS